MIFISKIFMLGLLYCATLSKSEILVDSWTMWNILKLHLLISMLIHLCQVFNLFGSFEIRLQNWLDWESALPCKKAIGMLHTHWGTRKKPPYYAYSDNQLKSVELCLKLNDPNLFLFLMWWQKLIHFTETSHLVNDRQNS